MLSSFSIDPTLHVVSDDRSKFDDLVSRMSSTTSETSIDADPPNFCRYWSCKEDDSDRLFPSWLLEQQLPETSWCGTRSPSPLLSSCHLDRPSHNLWTLGASSLLDIDDVDVHGTRALPPWMDEQSVPLGNYYCTNINRDDDGCSAGTSSSSWSRSVDAQSTTSSRSNSLSDDRDTPGLVWKRRRRRRRRRWTSRGSSVSRAEHISRHVGNVEQSARTLRSLLLHGCRYGGYRSPPLTKAAKTVSPAVSDVAGGTVMPRQQRQSVWAPLVVHRQSDDDATATVRCRCLEDHCYFNWKRAAMTDCFMISRHEDEQRVNSAPVSTIPLLHIQ